MSYALALGEDDSYAAGTYGVGQQSYYGRDSYAIPDPGASSGGSGGGGGSDSAPAAATPPSSSQSTPQGGSSTAAAYDDGSGDSGTSGLTLLVGLGAVVTVGYYLFFRGGR